MTYFPIERSSLSFLFFVDTKRTYSRERPGVVYRAKNYSLGEALSLGHCSQVYEVSSKNCFDFYESTKSELRYVLEKFCTL